MKTNCSITIYNRYILSGDEKYQRTQIVDSESTDGSVHWENRKASNIIASGGNIEVDQAVILIPMARGTNYLQPKEWIALVTKTGKWTLQRGDYVVKGLVTDTIGPSFTLTQLKAKYNDVLQITSVDTQDMGTSKAQHWQVGAK